MKIYIGADHNGYELKAKLSDYLTRGGYEVVDEGDKEKHPDDDFPQFAAKVVHGHGTSSATDEAPLTNRSAPTARMATPRPRMRICRSMGTLRPGWGRGG